MHNRISSLIAIVAFSALALPAGAQHGWSGLTAVHSDALTDTSLDEEPRLAVDEHGNAVAIWLKAGGVGENPSSADIKVASSFNGGASFRPWALLNLDAATNNAVLAADVVYAGSNNWLCLWVTAGEGSSNIQMARSINNGLTWSVPVTLYTGELANEVDIASDKAGTIIATFRTQLLRSTDFGMTWEPLTEKFPVNALFPTEARGLLEARIATNGTDTWIHAYSTYWGTFDRFVTVQAKVSHDNGQTWAASLGESIFSQQPNVLGDVAMLGDTAVVAFRYYQIPSVFVSSDEGDTWSSRVTVHEPDFSGYATNMWLAAAEDKWTLVAQNLFNAKMESYVTTDPLSWSQPAYITSDNAKEDVAALAPLPGGNVLALLQTTRDAAGNDGPDFDIYSLIRDTGGVLPPDEPASLALESSSLPKLKVKKKTGAGMLTWKVTVINKGDQDADSIVVRFWQSADVSLNNSDTLLAESVVKPIPAAKPGKKAKKKKAKLKADVGASTSGFIIAEILSPGQSAESILAMPY